MASYIYSEVQKAIGGQSTSSGFQKNWSPNKIRALYIMRSYIMVVDYLSGPKLTLIDENEVGLDLQNPNRIGSINNLLSSRQLSCLEEIYADEAFSRYPGVIDLGAYANSVMNSASRLRYYAYTSGIDCNFLKNVYYKAFVEGQVDFTYAKNIGGIRYVDTGNTDWYRKHNLRPQYYGPDADGGSLAAWFNKVEKTVSKSAKEDAERTGKENIYVYVLQRVATDVSYSSKIVRLIKLVNYCSKSGYELHKGVAQAYHECKKAPKPVSGLSKDLIISAGKYSGKNDKDFILGVQNMIKLYEQVGLFLPDAPFNLKKMVEDNAYPVECGFLNLGNILDRVLAGVIGSYGRHHLYKYAVNSAIMSAFPQGVPQGSLEKRLAGKVKVIEASTMGYIDNYFRALYTICGVSEEDLLV